MLLESCQILPTHFSHPSPTLGRSHRFLDSSLTDLQFPFSSALLCLRAECWTVKACQVHLPKRHDSRKINTPASTRHNLLRVFLEGVSPAAHSWTHLYIFIGIPHSLSQFPYFLIALPGMSSIKTTAAKSLSPDWLLDKHEIGLAKPILSCESQVTLRPLERYWAKPASPKRFCKSSRGQLITDYFVSDIPEEQYPLGITWEDLIVFPAEDTESLSPILLCN